MGQKNAKIIFKFHRSQVPKRCEMEPFKYVGEGINYSPCAASCFEMQTLISAWSCGIVVLLGKEALFKY